MNIINPFYMEGQDDMLIAIIITKNFEKGL